MGYRNGCRPGLSSGQWQIVGLPSLARPRVGEQRQIPPWAIGAEESLMVTIVTANPAEAPVCPGSGTFPDIVNDLVLDELSYVCAICGASVPDFEPAPVHRHAVPMVRSDPAVVGNSTTGRTNCA